MRDDVREIVDRLRDARSTTWLRVIDDARLDEPVVPDDDASDVVEPYRWLLERIGDGVAMTQAGYLPPALVREAMETLGWAASWYGKGTREDTSIPVLDLRGSAMRFGLLRKHKGRLLPTRAGRSFVSNPEALWWHLAARLPDARAEPERDAGVLVLLTIAAGRALDDRLLAVGMSALGWAVGNGERLLPDEARQTALDTIRLFRRLGLRPEHRWDEPEPPPSPAAVALARAALVGSGADVVRRPSAVRPDGPQQAVELTITLRDIEPPIWRRLVVPTSLTLRQTHEVLQTAMGWHDHHLHLFDVAGVQYGDVEDFDGPLGQEDIFTLDDARRAVTGFSYEYDFGDGWTHDVVIGEVVQAANAEVPHLTGGARACPPEDCGGPWGYERLLQAISDPGHEECAHLLEWTGGGFDPEAFDVDATNANLELFDRHFRR